MKKHKMAALAGALVLAAAAIGVGGMASAQEPTPAGGEPNVEQGTRRGNFLERVAEKLGITRDELRAAMQDAALDAVNEAEADGRITAEQAATARERIEGGEGFRGLREHRQDRREHRRDVVRQAVVESAAGSMGISADELKTELRAGNSIAGVAAEQGVDIETVKAAIAGDAEPKLEEAVANGRIDQEHADELLSALTARLDDIVNKSKAPATP